MRYKALLCLLLAFSVLCGCGSQTAVSTEGMEKDATARNGYVEDISEAALNGQYKAGDDELAALSKMKKVLSNQEAELYLGEYYDIAVRDRRTGSVWFSNQAVYDEELSAQLSDAAKAQVYSQVSLEYFDSAGSRYELSSYPDSFDSTKKNNVSVQESSQSLTVIYDFGDKDLSETICFAFTPESFEALEAVAKEKMEQGLLTRNEFARFTRSYKDAVLENLSDSERTVILRNYPQLEEWGELYLLLNPTDSVKAIVSKVSPILGVNKSYIDAEMEKIGIESNTVNQDSYFFEVPVTYTLDGADLVASIDTAAIVDKTGFYLTQVGLLGKFGAAHRTEDGYVFIPDGSGAVIENDLTTTGQSYLDIPFYGTDFCVNTVSGNTVASYAPFPVFGIKAGDKSVFAVCEQGDAIGGATAQVSNELTPYNAASAYLTYRTQDTNADGNFVYSTPPQLIYAVRYHFLYGESATYSGMARYYQKYLLQTGLLKQQDTQSSLPLQLSFLCAIDKRQQVLGMPMDTVAAASTLADVQTFVETMSDSGLAGIDYTLQGAINGGMDFQIPGKVQVEKVIGGDEAYTALLNTANTTGSVLNLGIDFTRVYKKGNGLKQNQQISRYISKNVAFISDYEPSSLMREADRMAYLINPQAYSSILSRFVESNAAYGNKNLYVASAASYLSSNFNDKYLVQRQQSLNLTENALQTLADAGYQLTLDGCNAYALAYAKTLTDVPTTSGGYAIESYAVPFAGMVLHGYVDYSGGALNNNGNYEKALLQSIESGAGLSYLLMTADTMMLSDTKYSDLFNVSASYWQERIIEEYEKLNAVFGELSDCTITDHRRVADKVFRTTYSNGKAVVVNYNDTPVTVDGRTIDGLGWAIF